MMMQQSGSPSFPRGNHGGSAERTTPVDAIIGKTELHVDGLRGAAVVAEQAHPAAVRVRDREIIELEISRVGGVWPDLADRAVPCQAVGADKTPDEASVADSVVIGDIAGVVFAAGHGFDDSGIGLKGAVRELVNRGGVVGDFVRKRGGFADGSSGMEIADNGEAVRHIVGGNSAIVRMVEAGAVRIDHRVATTVHTVGNKVANDARDVVQK